MAFDEKLADRTRRVLKDKKGLSEKKMFGGLAFLLGGKMCCGVLNDDLVARIGTGGYEKALKEPHVRPMDFTGRAMRGYVYVGRSGTKAGSALKKWLDRSVGFTSTLTSKSRR
jgi:TfoX/Sxy family transcriptional regulator of competence genes